MVKSKGPDIIIKRIKMAIGASKKEKIPIECWNKYITEDVLNLAVKLTNQYIEEVKQKYINLSFRERDIKTTSITQVRVVPEIERRCIKRIVFHSCLPACGCGSIVLQVQLLMKVKRVYITCSDTHVYDLYGRNRCEDAHQVQMHTLPESNITHPSGICLRRMEISNMSKFF